MRGLQDEDEGLKTSSLTDRGPYVKGRIVDLSVRAAKELGIISQGIAPVIVERYNPSIVPFKPEDVELPEFDLGTNDGPMAKPIWMELRDQRIRRRQEQERRDSINKKTLSFISLDSEFP